MNLNVINLVHCFCKNVEEWLKSHEQTSKSAQYCDDVRDLLHSETEVHFQNILDSCLETWSVTFQRYFQTRLLEDVRASSKFAVQDAVLFDSKSGVSTFLQ